MIPPDWLQQLKAAYPKRDGGQGWADAQKQIHKRLAEGYTLDQIMAGVVNYAIYCGRKGLTHTSMVLQAKTFVGPGLWFEEYAAMDLRTPQQKAEEAQWQALEARAVAMGFTTLDRSKGLYVAERAIEAEEAKRRTNVVQIPRARVVS